MLHLEHAIQTLRMLDEDHRRRVQQMDNIAALWRPFEMDAEVTAEDLNRLEALVQDLLGVWSLEVRDFRHYVLAARVRVDLWARVRGLLRYVFAVVVVVLLTLLAALVLKVIERSLRLWIRE